MLCDHLEGWNRESSRRGYGDICMHIADSLCYTAESNTTLYNNYTPVKMLKKKRKIYSAALGVGLSKCYFIQVVTVLFKYPY